jgi:hypothetical protein
MRIKLIVTGRMERSALHRSLARQFPVTGTGEPVDFLQPSHFQGPTSNPLPDDDELIPQLVREFCDALVAETLEGSGSDRKPPDLIIGIDDLELENLDRPHVVTRWIRRGVEDHLARNVENLRADARRREALASKCSFHLLVPMPEAYFFGERAALERAGVARGIEARLCREDLEAFETDDPAFVTRPNRPNEHRHPKAYLKHLLHRSEAGRLYKETRDGVRALENLAWPELSRSSDTLCFARSLFQDLADALDVSNPLGAGSLASSTYPAEDRRGLLLRNI